MKASARFITLVAIAAVFVAGCQRINLTDKSGKNNKNAVASSNPGEQQPPLDGDWTVTFVVDDNPHDSSVTFAQTGKQLTGQGTDDEKGWPFFITGTIDGKHIHFTKKYTDNDPSKQPVEYDGDLSYENDADYKGWTILGHYNAVVNGKPVQDKWVAVNKADQAAQQQQQQPQQTAEQPPQPDQQASDQQQAPAGPPDSVAGTWRAQYDYNFKRLDTRLFLKQQANKIIGDGVDTNSSKEDTWFQVTKGFYSPPRIMLVCHYEKGKHSPVTRDVIIKGSIQPDGHIKGETHTGAEWNAYPVR